MPLEIIQRERDGIQILDLKGQLIFGQEDLDFRNELDRLAAAGKSRVALNLSDLRELDNTGLETLLAAVEKLRKAGGTVAIYNMHPSHIELLVEAQMETALDVFETEQDAIDSIFPERKIKPYDLLKFVQTLKGKSSEALST
jgi:anti-anti-sigma factor